MQTASHTVVKPEITPHNRMLHMCLKNKFFGSFDLQSKINF